MAPEITTSKTALSGEIILEAVYRCDKLARGETPKNEILVSTHPTIREAMDEATRLSRLDRAHSVSVGMA